MSEKAKELLEQAKKEHNKDCMLCAMKDIRIEQALAALEPKCKTCEVEELRLVLLRIDNYCRVNDIDLEQFLNEPKCKTCNDTGKIYPEPIKQNGGEEHQSPPQSCPDCKPVESIEYYAARPELDILQSKIDRLEAENKAQAEQIKELRKYVKHKDTCGIIGGYGYCNCGLEQALKETE